MILEGHKLRTEQIYYSPVGKYYYIYKTAGDGGKYPVQIMYNKERRK